MTAELSPGLRPCSRGCARYADPEAACTCGARHLPTPASARELYRLARTAPAPGTVLTLPYEREWRAIAFWPAQEDGGGVTVSVSRMPAIFYRIDCPAKGITLHTGSGADVLAWILADALASGMLGCGDLEAR